MLKKTITYYLQNTRNVYKLIEILEDIYKSDLKKFSGKAAEKYFGALRKSFHANPEDDDVNEDENEEIEMMEIVGKEMDVDSSGTTFEEQDEVNKALRRGQDEAWSHAVFQANAADAAYDDDEDDDVNSK